MAEETKETVSVHENIMKLNSALEGLPGASQIMKSLGEEAIKTGDIKITKQDNPDNRTAPETVKPSVIPQMKTEEPEVKPETAKPEDVIDEVETNPLLAAKGVKNKKEVAFENFDQVKSTIKKDFGIDVKDEKDFGKILNSSKKWREDAAKVPELEEKITQFNDIFEKMPDSLLNSVKAFFNGQEDWDKEITSRPKFDFNKPVEKQNVENLVNFYFPGEFTKEDFDNDEKPSGLKIAEKAAKDRFLSDKREIESASAAQLRMSEMRLTAKKASIASSLNTLKQSFPEIDKAEEKRLTKALESGDILSLFTNKDGSYKPDAAKKLFLAEYGESAIENLMKVSAKRAESKANEDILTRGADKPKPEKGGAVNEEKSVEVKKVIDSMTQGLNRGKTY